MLGIGDENWFDWGGVVGALLVTVPVVAFASWMVCRSASSKAPKPPTV
jgi:hypothetical protein